MPLSGPIKPWTFYLSHNFLFIEKVGNKIILIVCVDRKSAYGFLVNSDKTGEAMKDGSEVRFSPFVTQRTKSNPDFMKCQALLTKEIQPNLRKRSFVACNRLYDVSNPLQPTTFERELFIATEDTKQAVVHAVYGCPTLSKVEKQMILTSAFS